MSQEKIKSKIDGFPVLPTTVANVMAVTSDPESSAKDLLQAVLPDQSMCIAILKVANSALFGQPKEVSSIERAIMVLGFNEVQSIVLGRAVVNSFSTVPSQYKDTINSFWEHSFTCGLAAKTIAENMGYSAGDFFIGGLIHDIGKLAMLLAMGDKYDPDTWMSGFSKKTDLESERKDYSLTHAEAGSRLLKRWSFPDRLLQAIAFHHDPITAGDDGKAPLIIQLADFYAHLCTQTDLIGDSGLEEITEKYLPDIKAQWILAGMPWDEMPMETWFNWLKIEHEHGSSVMSILAS